MGPHYFILFGSGYAGLGLNTANLCQPRALRNEAGRDIRAGQVLTERRGALSRVGL